MSEKFKLYVTPIEAGEIASSATQYIDKKRASFDSLYLSLPWGEHISLKEGGLETAQRSFNPITGSPIADRMDAQFKDFYNETRLNNTKARIETRGDNYHVAINPFFNTTEKRVASMLADYKGGIDLIRTIDRDNLDQNQYMLYLGALDYLKQHSLCLFHAISYPERSGTELAGSAKEMKDSMFEVARTDTRRFYQALLGQKFDEGYDPDSALTTVLRGADISLEEGVASNFFKLQELDHPLVIGTSAWLNVMDYPDRNKVVGLPAGGTQLAIATQLAYQYGQDVDPKLLLVPYSTHSAKKIARDVMTSEKLKAKMSVDISPDDRILVCDDNANTGTTLTGIKNAYDELGIQDVKFSIAELDPRRITAKRRTLLDETMPVANLNSAELRRGAVGITPITLYGKPDRQFRKDIPLRNIANKLIPILPSSETSPLNLNEYYSTQEEQGFQDFLRIYKAAGKHIGDIYGYRNSFMMAHYCFEAMKKDNLVHPSQETEFIKKFVGAGIWYPYLPDDIKQMLQNGQSSSEYVKGSISPWIKTDAERLLEVALGYSKSGEDSVRIWTKGDHSQKVTAEHLLGAPEQELRYRISGLHGVVKKVEERTGATLGFSADSRKIRVLENEIAPRAVQDSARIIAIDDHLNNLREVTTFCSRIGLECLPIKVGQVDPEVSDIHQIETLAGVIEILARSQSSTENTHVLIDMDDTLLHEGFVREHKPLNLYRGIVSLTAN